MTPSARALSGATRPVARRAVLEALESRRLLAFSGPNFELPFVNDFSVQRNGIEDVDGQNTGFPIVQGNTAQDEFQADLVNLDLDAGLLLLTSRGSATSGSNFDTDNSLANGLQLPFDAAAGEWLIHTRISTANAPLTQFDTAFEQGGILFGPTQDNYVKLVFAHDGFNPIVQFLAETTVDGQIQFPATGDGFKSIVTGVQGVNLANADYIDLWLSGDPGTGTISAQYRVEGGLTERFDQSFTFTGALFERFFRANNARAGLMVAHKNDEGPITVAFDTFGVIREGLPSDRPAVEQARPGPGETDVARDVFFAVDLELPNAGLDEDSLTASNVRLVRVSDGKPVEAHLNTTGGGDSIILTPLRVLDPETQYRFEITSGVTDLFGVGFAPYSQTITTGFDIAQAGGGVAFDQVPLANTQGELWTSVNVGPDGKLYATAADGRIVRWDINDDGTLENGQTITSIVDAESGSRLMTGLAFHPDSDADNLIAFVTHTDFNDVTTDMPDELGQDFTGKITRLSGDNLENVQDVVVGLPRSIRDHLTNQPSFGPDGRLYVPQGGNTAMGAPDAAWGFRPEHLLNAAILAVDVDAIGNGTLNAHTEDADPYDPFAEDAPLRLYATGVRNAYDLLWHSNGALFAPTNGSAAGGNTPQSPQPDSEEFGDDRTDLDINGPFEGDFVPGLTNVPETQFDYLFRIEELGYYGHPNPTRDEWVLNGGNPTANADEAEVTAYPVGTQPDRNWRGSVFNFGKNISPNGVIEYRSDAFEGALEGRLIVTRYSGGDDLIVLEVDEDGNVVDVQEGIIGFGGLSDPLDLAQLDDGSIYVTEFGAQPGSSSQGITLLRPVEAGGRAQVRTRRAFVDAPDGSIGTARFTIRNAGDAPLLLLSNTLTFTGADRLLFDADELSVDPVTVSPGASHTFNIRFTPPDDATPGDTFEAAVSVRTSDPAAPELTTRLFGLVTDGEGGPGEPSLQRILDLYGFDIDTGDDDASNNNITPGGDLVDGSLFRRVDSERPVIVAPIAVFGPEADPAVTVGFYPSGQPQDRYLLQEMQDAQQVDPAFQGAVKYDPAATVGETFGLWMQSPTFLDPGPGGDTMSRVVYSEAALNLWEPVAGERRKVFTYPAKLADGTTLQDTYIVTFEEFPTATDANDLVLIVRNVEPVEADGPALQVSSPYRLPFSDSLAFSQIDPGGRDTGQLVRNSQPVTITNVGTSSVTLDDVSASGLFSVNGFSQTTLAPGAATTFTVTFTADAGDLNSGEIGRVFTGTLTVADDDGGTSDLTVPLRGYNQRYTEDGTPVGVSPPANAEPRFEQVISLFGWSTDVGTDSTRNNNGVVEAVGDEVLSPFWRSAQPDVPIEVYQIDAFHQFPMEDFFGWYDTDTPAGVNEVFRNEGVYAQSLLPELNGGSGLAAGTFSPGENVFGIRVTNENSDPEENFVGPSDQGHHIRFFPLLDAEGNLVEDTWIMTTDFIGFNFDYNDNVYLIRGIEPASNDAGRAAPPVAVSGFRHPHGHVVIDWGAGAGNDAFTVYRSAGDRDSFEKLHANTIGSDFFEDFDPPEGEVYYRVFGVEDGEEGMFGEVRIV